MKKTIIICMLIVAALSLKAQHYTGKLVLDETWISKTKCNGLRLVSSNQELSDKFATIKSVKRTVVTKIDNGVIYKEYTFYYIMPQAKRVIDYINSLTKKDDTDNLQ